MPDGPDGVDDIPGRPPYREHATIWALPSVARAYTARPPYPDELIDLLASLVTDPSLPVLELGCGPGVIARG